MADNDLDIKIGADLSGLKTASQQGSAELNRLAQAVALLQKTVGAAARATSSELTRAIGEMGSTAASASSQVSEHGASLKKMGESAGAAHGNMSRIVFEVHALWDEFSSGRTSMMTGTFSNLIYLLSGGSHAAILMGAGAIAAIVGISKLVEHLHELKEAQETIVYARAFSGNFSILDPAAVDAAKSKIEQLKGLIWGIGNTDVANIIAQFERMGSTSNVVIQAMADNMAKAWKGFGDKEDQAAKNMAAVFESPLAPIEEIAKRMNGLTESERQIIADGQKNYSISQAQAAIQTVIAQRSAHAHAERLAQIQREIAGAQKVVDEEEKTGPAISEADSPARMFLRTLQAERDEIMRIDGNLSGWAPKIRAAAVAAEEFRSAMNTAIGIDPLPMQLEVDKAKLHQLYDEMGKATDRQTTSAWYEQMSRATGMLAEKVKEETERLADGLQERTKLQQLVDKQEIDSNNWRGKDRSGLLSQQIKEDQAFLAAATPGTTSYTEALKRLTSAQKELYDEQHKGGASAAKDQLGADRAAAQESIQLTEMETREKIKDADDALSHHRMTSDQYVATVKDALDAELSQIREFYAREESLAGLTQTQKANLVRQEALEEKRIMDELRDAQRKAADDAQKSWQDAMKNINSAFDSQIDGLLTGKKSFGTAFKDIAKSLVEGEIKNEMNSLLTGIEGGIGGALGMKGAGGANAQTNSLVSMLLTALGLNTAATTAHTTATVAGAASQAVNTASLDTGIASVLANTVSTDANTVATNFGAMMSGIGHIFGFATGTPMVSRSGLAVIHEGEAIIPANVNPFSRGSSLDAATVNAAFRGDSGRPEGGSLNVSPTTHFHISAVDGASVGNWVRSNGSNLVRALDDAVRHGAALGARRLTVR